MHLKFLKGYAHFDNSSWEELRSKGFSLMTFVLPCTIFLYDTRYLLHLLVLEPPYANRLLIDSGFYAAKPFRHCYLVHNWKKNKIWIFPPIFICFVNKTMHFPSSYWTPFSHLFREKIWNFCLNFPALLLTSISWVSTHCQVFSLNPIWQYSVQLLNCNFGIFVGKILWRSGNFKNVVEIFSEMMKRLFTFLLCNNNKSA